MVRGCFNSSKHSCSPNSNRARNRTNSMRGLPRHDQAILAKTLHGAPVAQDPNAEPAALVLRIRAGRDVDAKLGQRRGRG